MPIIAILSHIRFQDILDVIFLSFFSYHLYVWFRDTKAFRALVGLLALGVIYTAAQAWGLFLTTWMFQILWQVLIILLIILFQPEIRQMLERLNPLKTLGWHPYPNDEGWERKLAESCFELAGRRIGALVIIERTNRVDEHVTGGVALEAAVQPEIMLSIFQETSPLHDGALILRHGRIVEVGCFLPLSSAEGLPQEWGTRHRAALGISERCDAWALVVSEERGDISLARSGQLSRVESIEALFKAISAAYLFAEPDKKSFKARLLAVLRHNWRIKLSCLGLVGIVWLLLAGQQNFEVSLDVPVEFRNLDPSLVVVEPANPVIRVTVRGLRKDASTIGPRDARIRLDLTNAAPGTYNYQIMQNQVLLPNPQVAVVKVEPKELNLVFGTK